MATKIYVGRLAYETTEKELLGIFGGHGKVRTAQVVKDRDSGQSKGFAFIEMDDDNEALAAIQTLNGTEVGGRTIIVNVARPKEDHTSGRGSQR